MKDTEREGKEKFVWYCVEHTGLSTSYMYVDEGTLWRYTTLGNSTAMVFVPREKRKGNKTEEVK